MAGTPCTFIRLAGCPLSCSYCDTPQAIPVDSGNELTIDEVLAKVADYTNKLVLVTGGEPLAQRNCIELLKALLQVGYRVQLETAGAHDIEPVPDDVSVIMDIKTPDSGEEPRNRWKNIGHLQSNDEIKFVLCSQSDYSWASRIIKSKEITSTGSTILFSPAWQRVDPAELVDWVLRDHLPVRVQLQLHKYIWGAEKRSV